MSGGGLDNPFAIAIDDANNVWVANSSGNSISEFDSGGTAISGSSGFEAGSALREPQGIAIDGSGNVWVAAAGGTVEFVGIAVPVVTPIVANLLSPYGSSAVNRP